MKHRLAEGEYKLRIAKKGYMSQERPVKIQGGGRADISVTLEALEMNPYKLWGHVSFWSGLGLVLVGGILNWQAGEYQDSYKQSGSSSDRAANHALMGSAVAGYALGGSLLVTGSVLWILDPGDEAWAKKNMLSIGPGADGRGIALALTGRW